LDVLNWIEEIQENKNIDGVGGDNVIVSTYKAEILKRLNNI
jgi:hypothetical protein